MSQIKTQMCNVEKIVRRNIGESAVEAKSYQWSVFFQPHFVRSRTCFHSKLITMYFDNVREMGEEVLWANIL